MISRKNLFQTSQNGKVPASRRSSAPFLSGDSFMHLSDHVFLKEFELKHLELTLQKIQSEIEFDRCSLFVEVSALGRIEVITCLLNWLERRQSKNTKNLTMLIHNGDHIPSNSFFDSLDECGLTVYSVNSTSLKPRIRPLPIGLENRHLRKNGIGKRFEIGKDQRFWINPRVNDQLDVFSSFNISTNFAERNKAKHALLQSGYMFIEPNLTVNQYQDYVRKSRFVISPPGNGIDCHRTWEAIYLGAIPVVLRQYLSGQLIDMFPVFAISEWSEFLDMSQKEKDSLASSFNGRRYPAIEIDYWKRLISGRGEMI